MGVVGFIVMLFLFRLWKYVESQIARAEARNVAKAEVAMDLASLTRQELSDYKLWGSRNISHQGMQNRRHRSCGQSKARRIDGLTERLDNIMQTTAARIRQ